MKAIELLIDEELPPALKGRRHEFSAKGLAPILSHVAVNYPDKYVDFAKKLSDVGRNASWAQGETIRLSDLFLPLDKDGMLRQMDTEIAQAKKVAVNKKDFEKLREGIWLKWSKTFETESLKAARQTQNSIGHSIASGARGKPPQLKMMLTAAGVFQDAKDRTIPVFARHGFNEGLRPHEYLATNYGARKSVVATKRATAEGGDFGKQLQQAADDIIVTIDDCKTQNGLEYDVNDPWLKYRMLAKGAGSLKPGTIMDGEAPSAARKAGVKSVVVRSPMTCEAEHGVCAKCMGVNAAGKYPTIGTSVGVEGAQAISEPITQAALNTKHCLLVSETFVRTFDGRRLRLDEVQVGDTLIGEKDGRRNPVQVLAFVDQGLQDVFRYEFALAGQSGPDIVVCSTDCHKVLTPAGIKEIGKIQRLKIIGEDASQPDADAFLVEKTYLGKLPCADLTVAADNELFMLDNGAFVKNTGGSASGTKKEYSGFTWLRQFTQVPESFKDAAAVAPKAGKVQDVRKAPQGGSYIKLDEQEMYVQPGFEVNVKPGDAVEAGDIMSDGLASPYDVLKARGLGSGRKYYRDRFLKILEDSGQKTDPRNVELVTRANVRHVRINDFGVGDYLPDDVIDYTKLDMEYERPKDTMAYKPNQAVGKWLQAPVLHYTTGQQLTKRQASKLESLGYDKVIASDTPPMFEPELPRLRTSSQVNEDWMAGLAGSYLGRRLHDAAIRGQDTNIKENVHYAPRLSYGVDFAKDVERTGKF